MITIAVVGGGITGLTAAFHLRSRGAPVTLYEGSHRVGGAIQSLRAGGYLVETGPNTLLETSPHIAALIADLGLGDRLLTTHPEAENRYLARGGRPLPLPRSPLEFIKTPLFSWRAKLRLAAEPFIPRGAADREESVAGFAERRLGREMLDYAINPLVAGIYAGDPSLVSVRHAFPRLYALEQRYGSLILGQIFGARERRRRGEFSRQNARKLSFDEGLQVLTDALQRALSDVVELGAKVIDLQPSKDRWSVAVQTAGGVTRREHAALLFAGHPLSFPTLHDAAGGIVDCEPLLQLRYPPVASVALGFSRGQVAHPLDGFGMLIPAVERFRILGTLFSTTLFPGRAPEGHVLLTSYMGGERAPDLASQPETAIAGMALEDLRALLGIRGDPDFSCVTVYPKAIPQYGSGHGRLKGWLERTERALPGLFFGGNYRDGISLGDSINSGFNAAGRLLKPV